MARKSTGDCLAFVANSLTSLTPDISVIIPCYNSIGTISKAVESVLEQQVSCEIIVIDDGSTDGSHQLVHEKFGSSVRLICSLKNKGVGPARNLGCSLSTGKYVAFLDADDYLLPGSLRNRMSFLENSDVDLCYADYVTEDNKGTRYITAPRTVTKRSQFFYNHFATSTIMFRASVLDLIVMPPYRARQDWLAWHGFLQYGGSVAKLNKPVVVYSKLINGLSKNKFRLINTHWRIYRDHFKLGPALSVCALCINLIAITFFKVRRESLLSKKND